MLRTLQECLDEGSNGQVQLIKETQGRPSFKQVWEYLCGVHGYDPTFQCRKAWEGVTLKVSGTDLTKKEFLLFHSQYLLARGRVVNYSDAEEYTLLTNQLPRFWQDLLSKEEIRRRRGKHWVRVEGAVSKATVQSFFARGLDEPNIKVEEHAGCFLVECTSQELQVRATKVDGWVVGWVPIKVSTKTRRMTGDEILKWVLEDLTYNEEIKDSLQGRNESVPAREVHEVKGLPPPQNPQNESWRSGVPATRSPSPGSDSGRRQPQSSEPWRARGGAKGGGKSSRSCAHRWQRPGWGSGALPTPRNPLKPKVLNSLNPRRKGVPRTSQSVTNQDSHQARPSVGIVICWARFGGIYGRIALTRMI